MDTKNINQAIQARWDARFNEHPFTYGQTPVELFEEQLSKISSPGSVLLPAEGEGRHALFAAKKGWKVTAFDLSRVGRENTLQLAEKENLDIEYSLSGVLEFTSAEHFDLLGLFYAHWPAALRRKAHRHVQHFLKPGGQLVLQAFSKAQIDLNSGGPKNLDMLFSLEELQEDFHQIHWSLAAEKEHILDEGPFHQGPAQLIQLIGVKM